MRTEIAYVLTGMQERIGQALLTGVGVVVVFLAIVALVLYSAKRGWL